MCICCLNKENKCQLQEWYLFQYPYDDVQDAFFYFKVTQPLYAHRLFQKL